MSFLLEKSLASASRLHQVATHAYYRNPFYREKFMKAGVTPDQIHRPEDLSLLPFTDREELEGDPWILLSVPKDQLAQAHLSTGTSGRLPLYVFFNWEDLYVRGLMPLLSEAPAARLLGIAQGEIVFNALPYEVSVTGLAIHRALQDGIGACVVPVGKGGFYADPAKTLKLMRALGGDHLFTTPSYALHLAELAGGSGISIPGEIRLRSLWLIGEPCSRALRRRIEDLWGCPAFLYYGSLECGPVGLECSMRDGYHVASNFVHVEVVPGADVPDADADPPVGEVVVTVLWRQASPLLRFRTGDLGCWEPSACRCGIPGPRLRLRGRAEDVVAAVEPPRFALDIEEVLLALPGVSPWYRLKPEAGSVRVLLPGPPIEDRGSLSESIRAELHRRFGLACSVEFVPDLGYSGGKLLRVIGEQSGGGP
ncbi:MAG: phenylacetate--CoA ligase family protein [Candidatus Rokubacteria bacterium]|nr:phenylacetate--CoA ligase family protein [Candidatus Rokubacteria bacterium]